MACARCKAARREAPAGVQHDLVLVAGKVDTGMMRRGRRWSDSKGSAVYGAVVPWGRGVGRGVGAPFPTIRIAKDGALLIGIV